MVTRLCRLRHVETGFDTSKSNDFKLEDKERSGAPKKFEGKDLEGIPDEDRSQTLAELGETLQFDESTVQKCCKMFKSVRNYREARTLGAV